MSCWSEIDALKKRFEDERAQLTTGVSRELGDATARTLHVDDYGRWAFRCRGIVHAARAPNELIALAADVRLQREGHRS